MCCSADWLDHLQELYDSRDCTHAGITQLPMFSVQTSGDLVQPSWAGIPPDFSRLSGSELARLSRKGALTGLPTTLHDAGLRGASVVGGREYTAGLTCTTYMCEGRFYLPYLQQRLKQMGVQLVRRRITSLEVCCCCHSRSQQRVTVCNSLWCAGACTL